MSLWRLGAVVGPSRASRAASVRCDVGTAATIHHRPPHVTIARIHPSCQVEILAPVGAPRRGRRFAVGSARGRRQGGPHPLHARDAVLPYLKARVRHSGALGEGVSRPFVKKSRYLEQQILPEKQDLLRDADTRARLKAEKTCRRSRRSPAAVNAGGLKLRVLERAAMRALVAWVCASRRKPIIAPLRVHAGHDGSVRG